MDEGKKDDEGKVRFDLIPPVPLWEVARVYTHGAKEYEDRNWEKGIKWGRIFAAIMRHLWKWWGGEENDKDSGICHLAHAAWGCLTLLQYVQTHKDYDTRSKLSFSLVKSDEQIDT